MTKEQYLAKRQAMLNEASTLIDSGELAAFEAKKKEVETLDEQYENEAKARANLSALNAVPAPANLAASGIEVTGSVTETLELDNVMPVKAEPKEYRNAWAKTMMGNTLTEAEQKALHMVNDFTHTTENTGILIPETVTAGIWTEAGKLYPYWDDVSKTFVKGQLSLIKGTASTPAKWYDEPTETEDGEEEFATANLFGCELSRAISVGWKLKEMAIDDFIPYIQRKLAEQMGAALGYGSTHGKGKPGEGKGWKAEPRGVVTALLAQAGTPQVVSYTDADPLSYAKLTTARSKISGAYGAGLAWYANSVTIWTGLANILDENKRPMFVPDVTVGGVGRVLGLTVKEDDSMGDGEILLSNASKGYAANINKAITLDTEDNKKKRITDYIAYSIVDGDVLDEKAHCLLKKV